MSRSTLRAAAIAALFAWLSVSNAMAHCFVGGRFMPATLNIDDPCVADELSRRVGAVNTVRRRYFGDARPASTLVEVSALAIPEALVEIEAVALLPRRDA